MKNIIRIFGVALLLFSCTSDYEQEIKTESNVEEVQQLSNQERYLDEIFEVKISENIKFGEAAKPKPLRPNNTQELFMDIYEPAGDDLEARPLIIWAFGGAFVFGNKQSSDIVTLSNSFAKRGYVNASIDYRLSRDLAVNYEDVNAYEAVLRATHDMRAAIRYFYKDAETINKYKIDTTRIYIAGVSAGALAALNLVHFDELNEVPEEFETIFNEMGGFAGNSGNAGYSDNVAGVISLCGALLDADWINPAVTTPIVSMHGTEDNVVPYGTDTITLLDINLEVDGSATIHQKLDEFNIVNEFYTFEGAGHTPFVRDEAYMDTTIVFVQDFLYDLVK